MKSPPIEYEDLIALGMNPDAIISGSAYAISSHPPFPKLLEKTMAAAISSPPPEGDRMAYLRHVRDLLMGCTDWTQAADSPLSEEQRAAWATYRQALRDLPSTYSGEGPIPWPAEPA